MEGAARRKRHARKESSISIRSRRSKEGIFFCRGGGWGQKKNEAEWEWFQ